MHESTEKPYQFDAGWIARFMDNLREADPALADAVVKAASDHLKELNDKTI